MWINRVTEQVISRGNRVSMHASPEWGTYHIVNALKRLLDPLVWIDFGSVTHQISSVEAANVLSDAVTQTFGKRLFGYGLPLNYSLWILSTLKASGLRANYAITGSEKYPALERRLQKVVGKDSILVSCVNFVSSVEIDRQFTILDSTDLRIRWSEAREIASPSLTTQEIRQCYSISGGAYELFCMQVSRFNKAFSFYRPTAFGAVSLSDQEESKVNLIDILIHSDRWLDAFELQIDLDVRGAVFMVEEVASFAFNRGEHERFYELLRIILTKFGKEGLDVCNYPNLCYWYYQAGASCGKGRILEKEVSLLLDRKRNPDLEAALAVSNPSPSSLFRARRAFESIESCVTAASLGFAEVLAGQHEDAEKHLHIAIQLAEEKADIRQIVTAASSMALLSLIRGDYASSEDWAEWARSRLITGKVNDELMLLQVSSQQTYAALLLGKNVSNVDNLGVLPLSLLSVPGLEAVFSTLADVRLLEGDLDCALELYKGLYWTRTREQLGWHAIDFVRILLALNKVDQAVHVANRTVSLSKGTLESNQGCAYLAAGIVALFIDSTEAEGHLIKAYEIFRSQADHHRLAQVALYLATHYLKNDRISDASEAISGARKGVSGLTLQGRRFLGYTIKNQNALDGLLQSILKTPRFNGLGNRLLVSSKGSHQLSLRLAETLTILLLHPEGLSATQLGIRLYGDKARPGTVKSIISRLRRFVAISSGPYRIVEAIHFDALYVEQLVRKGEIQSALKNYPAPLLPNSSAPAIEEARAFLEELLRRAITNNNNPQMLLELANKLSDDLEVWENALSVTPKSHPLHAWIRTKIDTLQADWDV